MVSYENISVKFNNNYIIKDLNLNIEKNDKIVIAGKSGIGKTTLFHLLLGFVVPCKGRILFDGKCISQKNIWDIRKHFAYISQDINIGKGKVIDIISEYFSLKANSEIQFSSDERKKLFNKFFLSEELLQKDIDELSGGERQRISIIISIMLKRVFFLLDEATSALDAKLKKIVIDYFMAKKNSTVIAISHDKLWHNNKNVKIFNLENKKWVH